ncbi:hypothetical protein ATEIFO6365_0007059400 [Aspergillus terreus]|uniref:Uncharacterized protein n=1 Tax=Aspergillus terreus TaxID=33178 RepID=A0A5M3Z5H2_ASPTE|nr:hypothetical protein ATETN484_0009059400 [Aspergillus terreus]GFF18045.1 hypothetical protein ATEIFO6365_0007059400 [Aspergillus terreus]
MYAHAYERMWLWERYNMAVAMQTKDKEGKIIDQKEILPMTYRRGGEQGFNNQHWDQETGTREGPLHYNEFMLRVGGKPTNEKNLPPKITPPSSVDDLERAAQELIDHHLTKNLDVDQINPSFGKSGGGGKVNKGKGRKGGSVKGGSGGGDNEQKKAAAASRDDARYQRLFSALNEELIKWRGDETNYPKIKDWDTMMKPLTERIVQLRIEDSHRFMVTHFSRDDGLNLGDKIVTTKEKSLVPGGPDYERLDLGQTWEKHEDDVKKAINRVTGGQVEIKTFKDFAAWVTDYGNPDGRFAEETKANPSHFKTLQMWKRIDEKGPC